MFAPVTETSNPTLSAPDNLIPRVCAPDGSDGGGRERDLVDQPGLTELNPTAGGGPS